MWPKLAQGCVGCAGCWLGWAGLGLGLAASCGVAKHVEAIVRFWGAWAVHFFRFTVPSGRERGGAFSALLLPGVREGDIRCCNALYNGLFSTPFDYAEDYGALLHGDRPHVGLPMGINLSGRHMHEGY
ncbi:hypothetical protein B0T17DRAFT_505713 [Bombardia bombarda]|uniref:Uncharacterized protein n=1 Tax=Bombardia bombarda TaxID=252184 RepID=A0AA40C924_9PEZI|nr:hypothetical protein B0T17DRAFT_505713 [Bombardia bombarda]